MKQIRYFILLIVILGLTTIVYAQGQSSEASEQSFSVTDVGIGFSLSGLPADVTVALPGELQGISIMSIAPVMQGEDPAASADKVEISAEKLAPDMGYQEWRDVTQILLMGQDYKLETLKSEPVTVDGYEGTYSEIQSPEGLIWQVELFVNQTVYRIYTRANGTTESLFNAVLAGLDFGASNALPVNALPSLAELQEAVANQMEQTEAIPNLKFPYSGTSQITCAYHEDDPNCHSISLFALDFDLNYEPVRAAHNGQLYQLSDSCSGSMVKIVSGSYASWYIHLNRYFTGSNVATTQGAYIAQSGATGTCQTGPHLHFALSLNNVNIRPEPMCGHYGFLRYQTYPDCWPSSEVFPNGAYTNLYISQAAVDLQVCANTLSGKKVWASLWVNGYPAKNKLYSKTANNTCLWFYNMDGAGNTLPGVYYSTVAALRVIPKSISSMQLTSCAIVTGYKLFCDRVIR